MKRTPRGFAIYAEVTDSKGQEVRVQKSSAMAFDEGGECCWIFCHKDGADHMAAPQIPSGVHVFSPHLTRNQARVVAQALLEFADGAE